MEDLERNNSRLSPGFEANIAARAKVLVDRFAGQFLTMKWRDNNTVPKIPTVMSTKITGLSRGRTRATPLDASAVPSVIKSQRLSAIMKGLQSIVRTLKFPFANGQQPGGLVAGWALCGRERNV
jgi:hypothetical protein